MNQNLISFRKRLFCKSSSMAIVICLFLISLMSPGAWAQTIRYVVPTGIGSGSSWADPSGNIQAMIDASSSGDQVWIAGGTYLLSATLTMKSGVNVYGGFSGVELSIAARSKNSSIPWDFTYPTILDGQNSVRVLGVTPAILALSPAKLSDPTVWDGVTITKGSATTTIASGASSALLGAAGAFIPVNATLRNSIISNNHSNVNASSAVYGGAIILEGAINTGTATEFSSLISCKVEHNSLTNSSNQATSGGAVWTRGVEAVLKNCHFVGNKLIKTGTGVGATRGGALSNNVNATVIYGCLFDNNSITSSGTAASEGGAANAGRYYNCTFVNNKVTGTATSFGGAISSSAGVNVLEAVNCIFWGNSAPVDPHIYSNFVVQNSAIEGTYLGAGNICLASENDALGGPQFVNPAVGDYRLTSCSPMINLGRESTLSGIGSIPLSTIFTTDLAGNPRFFGGFYDLGAYEYQSASLTVEPAPEVTANGWILLSNHESGNQWHLFGEPIQGATGQNYTAPEGGEYQVLVTSLDGCATMSQPFRITPVLYVKPTATGTGSGMSWANATNDIQAMITYAREGEEVWVAGGTYPISATITMKSGVNVYGGFAGTETAVSQRSKGTELWDFTTPSMLDGQGQVRVINTPTSGTATPCTLDGFTITGGKITGSNGAGMILAGTSRANNCIITDNHTEATSATAVYGGGVSMTNANARLSNSKIANNTATSSFGSGTTGGSLGGGGIHLSVGATVENCLISGNRVERTNAVSGSIMGGGIYTAASGNIINCIIEGNMAISAGTGTVQGGGANSAGAALYRNCVIAHNTASSTGTGAVSGGGIRGMATTMIYNSMVWQNIAPDNPQILTATATYSAVEGGYTGTGNINLNTNNDAVDGPMFINPAVKNYRLAPCSPAIDAGNNTDATVEFDMDGNPRIVGTAVDMGAFEQQSNKPVITQNEYILTSNSATGNQWLLNGDPISGATNQTYLCLESGNYSVQVTYNANCVRTSDPITVTVAVEQEVTVSVNNVLWGSATGEGTYNPGDLVTITATPASNYKFLRWDIISGTITLSSTTTATATFIMPSEDVEVQAIFKIFEYDVFLTVNNTDWGSVTGEGAYDSGTLVTITATPHTNYQFVNWVVVNGNISLSSTTTATATFTMPNDDVTIQAIFKAVEFDVTLSVNHETWGTVTGEGSYEHGTLVTITALSNANYEFVNWEVISGGITLSSATTETATFTMPTGNVEVKAIFKAVEFDVTLSVNNEAWGTVSGEGSYEHGTLVTITATPNTNYELVEWVVVSGTITLSSSITETATFTMPSENIEIQAVFKLKNSIHDIETTSKPLHVWTQNGTLHIGGLNVGQPYSIYSILGTLLYQKTAISDIETLHATFLQTGIYIVQQGNRTVKILNQ